MPPKPSETRQQRQAGHCSAAHDAQQGKAPHRLLRRAAPPAAARTAPLGLSPPRSAGPLGWPAVRGGAAGRVRLPPGLRCVHHPAAAAWLPTHPFRHSPAMKLLVIYMAKRVRVKKCVAYMWAGRGMGRAQAHGRGLVVPQHGRAVAGEHRQWSARGTGRGKAGAWGKQYRSVAYEMEVGAVRRPRGGVHRASGATSGVLSGGSAGEGELHKRFVGAAGWHFLRLTWGAPPLGQSTGSPPVGFFTGPIQCQLKIECSWLS